MTPQHRFLVSLTLALALHAGLLTWWWSSDGNARVTSLPAISVHISTAAPAQPTTEQTQAVSPASTTRTANATAPARRPQSDAAASSPATTDIHGAQTTPTNRSDEIRSTAASATADNNSTQQQPGDSRSEYLARIRRILDRGRDYPPAARQRRIEGTVEVRFAINGAGDVARFHIAASSGSDLLDGAARDLFTRLHFPPLPPVFGEELSLAVPIDYRLN